MRTVLDTNIVVSRYLVTVGNPAQIFAAWRAQRFDIIVSSALLAEYERVLNYERLRRRHGMTRDEVAAEVVAIAAAAVLVEPADVPAVIAADPDDHVLAAAVAGAADYIVSGDPHLLSVDGYRGIRILSPSAFLTLLSADDAASHSSEI